MQYAFVNFLHLFSVIIKKINPDSCDMRTLKRSPYHKDSSFFHLSSHKISTRALQIILQYTVCALKCIYTISYLLCV